MKSSNPEPPPPLGEKVVKPPAPQEEWRPVPGKPGFFVNAKGQMKFAPPL